MNHFIIYLLLGLKSAQGVVVYRRGVCEVGVEMWMEPEDVPVNVLEALSYGTGAGLRRDVGMDHGPCASFLLFYHVRPRMEIWESQEFDICTWTSTLYEDLFNSYKGMNNILFNSF